MTRRTSVLRSARLPGADPGFQVRGAQLKKISLKTKGMLNSFISKAAKTTIIFAKLTPNANEIQT
jgi:hypothetical protein